MSEREWERERGERERVCVCVCVFRQNNYSAIKTPYYLKSAKNRYISVILAIR